MKSKILYLTTVALAALSLALPLFALSGCIQSPLRGGKANTAPHAGGILQDISQGENPAQASAQSQDVEEVRSYTLPAQSVIASSSVTTDAGGRVVTNRTETLLSLPTPIVERRATKARTELGAAQKDTAREIGAKLASLRIVVWVGVALFIFGVASLFWPPLKLIVASVTTSAALTVGGLALIVLPSVIVGNELLIMGGVFAIILAWWFAHRHGGAQATVKVLKQRLGE